MRPAATSCSQAPRQSLHTPCTITGPIKMIELHDFHLQARKFRTKALVYPLQITLKIGLPSMS